MSRENVESYRRAAAAWARGDLDAALAFADEDAEIISRVFMLEGSYRGHEGVRRWWQDLHDSFPDWDAEVGEVRALGDATLAVLHVRAHGGESGAPVEETMWHLARWRNGQMVRLSSHNSEAEALEAAGLSGTAMSRGNVEVVRQVVEAINRRDADAFVATVSPEVEWEDAVFWTESPRTFRGRAGVRDWLNQILEPWESVHLDAEEVTDVSDGRFVVGFAFTARGKESGVETQLRFWALCWVADGTITRREVFHERAEALEAAGLRE